MQRTTTKPNAGVEERRNRVGQDRPSGTADQGISQKVVAVVSGSTPHGTISLGRAKELLGDPALTDEKVEEIKEHVRLLVEIIYEKWSQDRVQSKGQG